MKTVVRIIYNPERYTQLMRWSVFSVMPILVVLLFFSNSMNESLRFGFILACLGIMFVGFLNQKELVSLRRSHLMHLSEYNIIIAKGQHTKHEWRFEDLQNIQYNIDDTNPMQGSLAKSLKMLMGKMVLDTIELTDAKGNFYVYHIELDSDFQKKKLIQLLSKTESLLQEPVRNMNSKTELLNESVFK